MKPAPIFGAEDRLLNWIGETINRVDYFPLLNKGANIIQPVWCVDVAKAIMQLVYVCLFFSSQILMTLCTGK